MSHVAYSRVQWKDIDWDAVLDGETTAPCYYLRSGLVRKDLLPAYAGRDAPETVVVDSGAELAEPLRSRGAGAIWVLKKASGSNASGIVFLRGDCSEEEAAEAAAHIDAAGKAVPAGRNRRVLQRYVVPATVRGRKFHIRMPVLAVGALAVYCHTHCRVIVATEPWSRDAPSSSTFVHVTNLNVNCRHRDYAGFGGWDQNFCMWAWPQAQALAVWSGMCAATSRLFSRVFPHRRAFFALRNCYELFGLDFVVSSEGQVLLLEVNPDPGLSMFHVLPPTATGVVESGSQPLELSADGALPPIVDAYSLPFPPPGHLGLPVCASPFVTPPAAMLELGYLHVLTLTAPVPASTTVTSAATDAAVAVAGTPTGTVGGSSMLAEVEHAVEVTVGATGVAVAVTEAAAGAGAGAED